MNNTDHSQDQDLLTKAYQAFDAANAKDPNAIDVDGVDQPKELVFAKRLTEAVAQLAPNASIPLQLAARCQHICRWEVPRSTQPMNRAGYLKWRAGLKKYHAKLSATILEEVGYDSETIQRAAFLNEKKNIKTDPESQTIEDALCLVFLQYQFDKLIEGTEEEKIISIVQKTWKKMSAQGHNAALKLPYSEAAQAILAKAL